MSIVSFMCLVAVTSVRKETHTQCKNKVNFTAVNICIGHQNFFALNIRTLDIGNFMRLT